jgi:hypothetical protein
VKTRSYEPAKSRNRESAKFRNLLEVKFGSHDTRRFPEWGDHEPVRSKFKNVVPKSPGLVCELVAGL